MNHTVKYLALFSLAFSLAACDDDGLDVRDVEIPQGYALSAGVSTIFLNSSVAYDTQADWIDADPDYAMRFRDGDGLYDDTRTISGGLGPVYAGYSCGSCHRNAGRTKPELWNGGGSFGGGCCEHNHGGGFGCGCDIIWILLILCCCGGNSFC